MRALVVGAVLLDVVGKPGDNQKNSSDKIGNVGLSVGGVAFNIAANLKHMGVKVNLITSLRKSSPISKIIKNYLMDNGIGTGFIIEKEDIQESVYMAIGPSADDYPRLTSSSIQWVVLFDDSKIKRAVRDSDMVIADTNLSHRQISTLKQICCDLGKPFCVVVASDAKATRVMEADSPAFKYKIVSMNIDEARKIKISLPDPVSLKGDRPAINSEIVVVTCGESGAYVFMDAQWRYISPPEVDKVVNRSGAGDVLFSGICKGIMRGVDIFRDAESEKIRHYVHRILISEYQNLAGDGIVLHYKRRSEWILGFILSIVVVLISVLGLSPFARSATWIHWAASLVAAGSYGSLAAWLKIYFDPDGEMVLKRSTAMNVIAGFVVGFFAALLGSIPNLAELAADETPSRMVMLVHFLGCTVLGTIAGLQLARTAEDLMRKNLPA